MVKVYRYRVYDITIDDFHYSTRMATKERIERISGERIERTETNIDADLLADGWTEKNFDPGRPKPPASR
jgi:hypothetical protein